MIVSNLADDVPFSTSDHNSLYFSLIVSCDDSDNWRLFDKSDYLYDFDNADYISIGNYLLNIDWLTEFGACTSAVMFEMCTVTTLPSFFQHMFHVNIFLVHVKREMLSIQRTVHHLLENCKPKRFVLGINTKAIETTHGKLFTLRLLVTSVVLSSIIIVMLRIK